MNTSSNPDQSPTLRLAAPPTGAIRSLMLIGPMLLILGTAIGTGELVAEPAAGARYGGAMLWAILFIVVTKAFWNEAIGRVSIVTGQDFLETCSSGGPLVWWVPWAWYAVNVLKDFFLRGGITAIAGLICYDVFGPLPLVDKLGQGDTVHQIAWTLLNYALVWSLLVLGGYRIAEYLNTALSILFTACLVACAVAVLPQAMGELVGGLLPRLSGGSDQWLMLMTLSGIVMSGSTTVFYSAWAEERQMGMFGFTRKSGRRLTRREIQPQCQEEIQRMLGWLRVNSLNVAITYILGLLICLSTFVLGVAVLRPAGVTLGGPELARQLSLMMTSVAGSWAKPVFYVGAYAAVTSTAIGILDGAPRMYAQPLRRLFPTLFERLSPKARHRIIMTVMVIGCWSVYVFVRDAVQLVVWMGAVDAPMVGILFIAYAYMARFYLPGPYRRGTLWTLVMVLIGTLYFAFGVGYVAHRLGIL
ncbi:MAG: Nramp family divalent metal transporter [Planctomycetota bacterium]